MHKVIYPLSVNANFRTKVKLIRIGLGGSGIKKIFFIPLPPNRMWNRIVFDFVAIRFTRLSVNLALGLYDKSKRAKDQSANDTSAKPDVQMPTVRKRKQCECDKSATVKYANVSSAWQQQCKNTSTIAWRTAVRKKNHCDVPCAALPTKAQMGPVRTRYNTHNFGWQSSHSVDLVGWQAKMATIEIWIPWSYAHKPNSGIVKTTTFLP